MTHSRRFAALLLLSAGPAPLLFSADAPVVIERAPDADQSAAQAEAAALRRENEQLKTSLATTTAAKQLSDSSLKDATRELATLRAKVAQLEKPAAEASAEKSRAQEALARVDTLTSDLEKLTQEKNALQADNARLKSTTGEQARLATELEKLRAEKAAAAATPPPPDLTAKLADTQNKLDTALHSFSQLRDENDRLKAAATEHATQAAELEKLRAENASLESRLAAAASTPAPETVKTPDPDLAAKLADTENKLSTTLASFSRLQAENDRLKTDAARAADLSAQLDKLRDEKAALEAHLASVSAAAAAPPPENPETTRKLAEAEDKLTTALRSYSLLQQENDRLKADAASTAQTAQATAAKNAGDAAAQISQLYDELRQTQAHATSLAAENADLKTRLAIAGPPPGTTLSAPVRPGTPQAASLAQPTASSASSSNPDASSAATAPSPSSGPRTHTVVPGDNLAKLARQYYGNANRWEEILRANRDVIKNENLLPLGATLQIP